MFRTYFTSSFSGLPGTIVFRGYIDCSGDPNYPAAISGDMYVVSVAGRIGGASGVLVEIGDQITCITDNAGGTQVAVGNDFSIAQANITYVPENAALKDTANGYPGLTSFKINFLNFLGTFTSYFQNTNTASRLYSFQDRDGTIADNTDLALKQDLSGKDASNGYPGLTLFKINFKNVANTFTSFFTNSNTAARTYTFQDRTDTIADLTDIAGVLTTQTLGNLINSATAKTTPVDADMLPLMDSAAGNITKKLSWLNVKATLKTYFDTLYESLVNKDASGGYVGLTLFKINFKNAANTFTSFFTNANTAARTYTFQDRDGTIADNTDLAGKLTNVLTSGNIFVGNGSNVATGVAMSGDVTISNAGVTAIGSGKVTEAMQILADNTTNNVSITKHGYAPKAPNNATKFLDGTGAWSTPAAPTYYSYNKIKLTFSGAVLTYSGETNVSGVLVRPASNITITGAAGWRYVVCNNTGVITIETIPGGEITTNSLLYTPNPPFNSTYYGYYSSVNTTKRIIGIAYFDATNITYVKPYGIGVNKNDDYWETSNAGVSANAGGTRLQFTAAWNNKWGQNIVCVDNGPYVVGSDAEGFRVTFQKAGFGNIGIQIAMDSGYVDVHKNGTLYKSQVIFNLVTANATFINLPVDVLPGDYFTFVNTINSVGGQINYMTISFTEW